MERLTREMTFEEEYSFLQKEAKELFDKEDRESEPPESHSVVRRALRCIKKLVAEVEPYKAYKDLEEQELLIKLPCKVGDMVWFNTYKHGEDVGLQPHKVEEVRVRFLMERDYADPYTEIPDYDFGKTVFLTKEEAEAKLKELEGSEEE